MGNLSTKQYSVLPTGSKNLSEKSSRDIPGKTIAGQTCPLCNDVGEVIHSSEDGDWRECCNSLLSWPWDSEKDYYAWYENYSGFHSKQQLIEGFPTAIDRDPEHLVASMSRCKVLKGLLGDQFSSESRLLDVGAGTGAFVSAASLFGLQSYGLELCPHLVKWAREEKHRDLRVGGWSQVWRTWDIITLHDVLEHLTEPEACLTLLSQRLEPGGSLVIEIPEWKSPHAVSEGWNWRHFRPLQHLWMPSREAAEILFRRVGLEPIAWWRPVGGLLGKCSWILRRS